MTEIEQILQSLKSTLGIPMTLKSLNEKETKTFLKSIKIANALPHVEALDENAVGQVEQKEKLAQVIPAPGTFYITKKQEVWFVTPERHESFTVITVPADRVTETEIKLIGLLLSNLTDSGTSDRDPRNKGKGEEERYAQELGEWLQSCLKVEDYHASLPEEFKGSIALRDNMIPFLLVNESEHPAQTTFKALQRLLRSYFGGEIVLVPLQNKDWLILADPRLLDDLVDEKDDPSGEGEQDLLALFCMGLYELVSNEWVGDFHIAAIPEVGVQEDLPYGLRQLRETMMIGRTFQVKERIHLSTGLHLERLLFSIPEVQRSRFLEEYAGHHSGVFEDTETLSTLETFFELDCNVSETAKQLYIHRNTLLYRLDKIKQETGLDVRSFGDAVLVKITLLLYKLTKRK